MLLSQPVLVLGGGPVGLAAALELARFHVPTIVFEKHRSTVFTRLLHVPAAAEVG